MAKVMELYSKAKYTPVTIKSLRRKVVDIIKEMYEDPPEELKDVTIYPDIDPDDIEEELDGPYESSDYSIDEGSINEADMYDDLLGERGVAQLRCFLAQNMSRGEDFTADDNYDDIVDAMSAFHVDAPNEEPFIHAEVDAIREDLVAGRWGQDAPADNFCNENDVVVDGDYTDPRSYRLVMRALGSTGAPGLFSTAEMETDSEDEFERGAAQVSHNLGFVADPERYEPDDQENRSLHLSDLQSLPSSQGDNLSTASSIDLNDTASEDSLDLTLDGFTAPSSPEGASLSQLSGSISPIRNVGVVDGDLTSTPVTANVPQSPPGVMRLRRRLRTADLVDGDLTNTPVRDEDQDEFGSPPPLRRRR